MKALMFGLVFAIVFGGFISAEAQTVREIKVGIGRTKSIVRDRLNLRFLTVVEDSRCPIGVNCIQAGNAQIKVQISKPGGQPKIFELNTNGPNQSIMVEGYEVKLTSLTPHPKAGVSIRPGSYTATISVAKRVR